MNLFTYSDIAAAIINEDFHPINNPNYREDTQNLLNKDIESDDNENFGDKHKKASDTISKKMTLFLKQMGFFDNIFIDPLCRYLGDTQIKRTEITPIYTDIIRLLIQTTKKSSYQYLLINKKYVDIRWSHLVCFFESLLEKLDFFDSDLSLPPFNKILRNELRIQLSDHFNHLNTIEKYISTENISEKLKVFFRQFIGLSETSKTIFFTDPYPEAAYLWPNESYNPLNNPQFIIYKSQLLDIWNVDTTNLTTQIEDIDLLFEMIPLVDITRINNDTIIFSTPDYSSLYNKNTRQMLIKNIAIQSTITDFYDISEKSQLISKSLLSYIANRVDYSLADFLAKHTIPDNLYVNRSISFLNENRFSRYSESLSEYIHSESFDYEDRLLFFPQFPLLTLKDRCFLIKKYRDTKNIDNWCEITKVFIELKRQILEFFIDIYTESLKGELSLMNFDSLSDLVDGLGDIKKYIKIDNESSEVDAINEVFDNQLYQLKELQSYKHKYCKKQIYFKFSVDEFLEDYDIFPSEANWSQYSTDNFYNFHDYLLSTKINPFSMIDYFCAHFQIANFSPEFPGLFAESSFFYKASLKIFSIKTRL